MINAIVIGVRPQTETSPGNFGRFHAINLSQRKDIDRLIVTSTTETGARANDKFFGAMLGAGAKEIAGVKIANRGEFERQLDFRKIGLVVISAKEAGSFGNSIHVDYAVSGLNHSSKPFVLCEKPASDGNDGGIGVQRLEAVGNGSQAQFDLHLPVYLIFRSAAEKIPGLRDVVEGAKKIEICWAVKKDSPAFIIDNLGPHAWSAIGENREVLGIAKAGVGKDGKNGHVEAYLKRDSGISSCSMGLSYEFSFRGARFDGYAIQVVQDGPTTNVMYRIEVPPNSTLFDAASAGTIKQVEKLAVVENPLGAFIDAGIKRTPIVGMDKALELQAFLRESYELAKK